LANIFSYLPLENDYSLIYEAFKVRYNIINKSSTKIQKDFSPDVIVAAQFFSFVSLSIAQKHSIPVMFMQLFPPISQNFTGIINLDAVVNSFWKKFLFYNMKKLNLFRKNTLGIEEIHPDSYNIEEIPKLFTFSKYLLPKDTIYSSNLYLEGCLEISDPFSSFENENDVEQFLQNGTAPIFLGMGSNPVMNEKILLEDFIDVCVNRLKMRGILCGVQFSSLLTDVQIPEDILVIKSAPFNILFPRCFLAIHHGGKIRLSKLKHI